MKVDIRYKPAFATLFVTLAPGERIVAESDAMASMSGHVEIHTRWNGGFWRALLRRIFGGESLFINEFVCPVGGPPAQLVLTQPIPGDIEEIQLSGTTLYLQPGAFVACDNTVKIGLGYAGLASWFNGEGLFRMEVSGHGRVWMGGYGGIFARTVNDELVVDSGHVVAYEPTLSLKVGMAGGIFSSLFSGEGFVTRARGQGRIYLQSRNLDALAAWTNGHLL